MENGMVERKKSRGSLCLLWLFALCLMLSLAFVPATARAAGQPRLSKTRLTLVTGKSKKLKVKGYKGKVQWVSTNPYVAKVSGKGKVKAKHMGYTVILVKAGDVVLKCPVTVNGRKKKKEKPFIFCYEVDREGRSIETGNAYNLAVMNGYYDTWNWKVSNTDYATLYDNGNHGASAVRTGKYCQLVETFMGKSGTVLVTATNGSVTLQYQMVIHPSAVDAAYVNLRNQVLSSMIRPGMRAQEKCLVIAKWLSNYASYKITNAEDYSLLKTGVGQCYHYARTYDFLMDGTGIPCDYISSKGNPGHAWNQVQIDGAWYNVDVTSFDNTENNRKYPFFYQYFMVSDYQYAMKQPRYNPYHVCTSRRFDFNHFFTASPWETGEWVKY